jgi:hypothetical protein
MPCSVIRQHPRQQARSRLNALHSPIQAPSQDLPPKSFSPKNSLIRRSYDPSPPQDPRDALFLPPETSGAAAILQHPARQAPAESAARPNQTKDLITTTYFQYHASCFRSPPAGRPAIGYRLSAIGYRLCLWSFNQLSIPGSQPLADGGAAAAFCVLRSAFCVLRSAFACCQGAAKKKIGDPRGGWVGQSTKRD